MRAMCRESYPIKSNLFYPYPSSTDVELSNPIWCVGSAATRNVGLYVNRCKDRRLSHINAHTRYVLSLSSMGSGLLYICWPRESSKSNFAAKVKSGRLNTHTNTHTRI